MSPLYKFRPLSTCNDFKRISEIIIESKFWFSQLWDQNDSMEAVYNPDGVDVCKEKKLTPEKINTRICSFSSEKGLFNPLMWAHYASGFKGVAIELNPKERSYEVVYRDDPSSILLDGSIDNMVKCIVTGKSRIWEYESEYRMLVKNSDTGISRDVGEVSCVVIGRPYDKISNIIEIYKNSENLANYKRMAKKVIKTARNKGISVKISGLTITPSGPIVEIREENGDFNF